MILERQIVDLPSMQKKVVMSGWGESSIDGAVVERITYLSDGLKVKGYLAYPKDKNNQYPCIIWCRGGFGNAGALDDFYASGILGQLASWGYVVFQPQYRGNVGGNGIDEFGGNDLNDVLNCIPLASELDFADDTLWGIEGWSRGGMMTYLALTKTDIFKAAISTGGISDLQCTIDDSSFMKKLFDLKHLNIDDNFCTNRSILNQVELYSKSTPTLLIHGANDDRVPARQSLNLSYKFIERNIEHRLLLLENGDHFLRAHKKEVDEQRKFWLNKYLNKRS